MIYKTNIFNSKNTFLESILTSNNQKNAIKKIKKISSVLKYPAILLLKNNDFVKAEKGKVIEASQLIYLNY